ncbi:MAG TPA: hypothetical protein VJL59_09765 [Anaerolineales bacterium]|nr:hypothetical protein [Anaerolineales bacterium]
MNLAEWRAKQRAGELLTLPSGLEVTARKVGLYELAATGEIPQTLWVTRDRMAREGWKPQDLAEFMPMFDLVVEKCMLKPAIAETEDDDHISLKEMPVLDRMFIFSWANGEASALVPFPGQPAVSLADAPGGDHVWSEAEHPA